MKKIFLFFLILVALVLAGCARTGSAITEIDVKEIGESKAIVYKSQSCGCCVGYAALLKKQGFQVEEINTYDISSIKEKYKIPIDMESCHTTVISNYFIEGHVPFEAVKKLLQEKPDIDGIALPGMPSGSPGMPGSKLKPFEVYAIKNGQLQGIFIVI